MGLRSLESFSFVGKNLTPTPTSYHRPTAITFAKIRSLELRRGVEENHVVEEEEMDESLEEIGEFIKLKF